MTRFLIALLVFLVAHLVPALPALRRRLVARLGRRLYLALYSAASLALFAWLVAEARSAPAVPLWDVAPWQGFAPILLMPVAGLLLVAGLMQPNPLSISLRPASRLPAIAGITRHPVLWAALLWALSHIPPNGRLAPVILFGAMAAFSAAGFALLDAKARRRLGPQRWAALAGRTSVLPFAALLRGRAGPIRWRSLVLPAVLALALYAWFLLRGHAWLIGPDPADWIRAA
ncbi:MAG: NnrU family protein [Alsobacter sp.]